RLAGPVDLPGKADTCAEAGLQVALGCGGKGAGDNLRTEHSFLVLEHDGRQTAHGARQEAYGDLHDASGVLGAINGVDQFTQEQAAAFLEHILQRLADQAAEHAGPAEFAWGKPAGAEEREAQQWL